MSKGKRGKARRAAREESVFGPVMAGIVERWDEADADMHAADAKQVDLIVAAERQRRIERGQSPLWVITEAEVERLREAHRASPMEVVSWQG